MKKIELDGVSKEYSDNVLAVDDVSLSIEDGEFMTLVGPSGCGKTTTLRMIAGFEQPTKGRVKINGEDVTGKPPYRRNTGMVFQNFALFPHMTVAENIAYGMNAQKQNNVDSRVNEMLELVQLPGYGDRKPSELSGGQQQRIALARALAPRPEVLLLDEPLASLDKKLREEMQIELQRIQRQVDITTVFVTHNQDEALTLSDKIAVMNGGEFEQVGTPADVYDQPDTRFVADFLGTSNIFEGEIASVDGDYATVESGGKTLAVKTSNHFSVGESVNVVVRPEKLTLSMASQESKMNGDNHLVGKIDSKRHLGSIMEYHISCGEKEMVAVQQRTGEEMTYGNDVNITFSPDNSLLIKI